MQPLGLTGAPLSVPHKHKKPAKKKHHAAAHHAAAKKPAALPKAGPHLLATDANLHWLRRFTFGPTPGLISELTRYGHQAWFAKQLTVPATDDPQVDTLVAGLPMATATPAVIRAAYAGVNNGYADAARQLQLATLSRQLYSSNQLQERMAELWWDRLHVSCNAGFADVVPQRDQLLRANALGRFRDLLPASTRDPAMLQMLSATYNKGSNPNENLGRELLELHTVGVGNYSETDVHNSALVLTGLTMASDGTPTFNPKYHYTGPVQVMGWSSANATQAGGDGVIASYLDYLATHPATAAHVSTMIARRFVSDTPDAGLIAAMTQSYLANDTRISAVLQTMVGHPAFAASAGGKLQGPSAGILASVRMFRGVPVGAPGYAHPLLPLLNTLNSIGVAPHAWPTPEGPHDDASAVSAVTMLVRWNLHEGLVEHGYPGLSSPSTGLLGVVNHATPAGTVVDKAAAALLHQQLRPGDRTVLLKYLGRKEKQPLGQTELIPGLLSTIANSPYGAAR